MTKSNWNRLFTKWHRRIGTICALFLLMLAITGLLLNHSHILKLDQSYVTSPLLLDLYGIELKPINSVIIKTENSEVWTSAVGKQVYFSDRPVSHCATKFIGAVRLHQFWAILCERSIKLLTENMQLMETIDKSHGLPTPLLRGGLCNEQLCVEQADGIYQINLETLTTKTHRGTVVWAVFEPTPITLKQAIQQTHIGRAITWERFLLDLHSGRYFGNAGVLILDIIAILIILLASSGLYLWYRRR